jgi:hypothetical protein
MGLCRSSSITAKAWLFGILNSVEVWYDAGGPDFPLQRIQGAFNELAGANSQHIRLPNLTNGVFWLGGDARGEGIVYRTQGYSGIPHLDPRG